MSQSDAQKRAIKKYLNKFDDLRIRVPAGEKEIIDAHAASMNESTNSFVRRAIALTMEHDRKTNNTPD